MLTITLTSKYLNADVAKLISKIVKELGVYFIRYPGNSTQLIVMYAEMSEY